MKNPRAKHVTPARATALKKMLKQHAKRVEQHSPVTRPRSGRHARKG